MSLTRTALATTALTLLAAPVAAQTVLDTIVISAFRTAAERERSGASVTAVEAADLDRAKTTTLAEYLSTLPGVTLTQSGPFGNTANLRIRGADGRYLAVYIDGIRVSDPTGTTVFFDFGSLMTDDVRRIEVLRGSQSALWGGSAVGGVINISTRAGLEEGFRQSLAAEAGSFGSGKLSYGLTQKDDRLELAFTATRFQTDGFSAIPGGAEKDGAEATRLSFSARYQLSDTLAVGGAAFVQRTEQDYDAWTDPDGDWVYDTAAEAGYGQTRTERGARVFAELALGNTDHMFDLAYFDIDRAYTEPEVGVSTYAGNRLTFGWQATTHLSDPLTLVYGLDWSRERAEYSFLPGGVADTTIAGAFAQVLWSPSEALDIAATVRVDRNSAFGTFPTGRLALAWRPAEGTTIRAAAGLGFRAPSIDERFGEYPEFFFTGNPDLEPEESRSYEIGVEHAFAGGATLSATLYRLEIDNLIQSDPVTFSTLVNLPGESVRKGVELGATLPLGERVRLGFAYTYTDARRPNGARLVQVPRHALALSLDADLTERLSAGVVVKHASGRLDNDHATFAVVAMPDYTVVNAQLNYALTERAEAYLRIENLTDTDYQLVNGYATAGRSVFLGVRARF